MKKWSSISVTEEVRLGDVFERGTPELPQKDEQCSRVGMGTGMPVEGMVWAELWGLAVRRQ